MKDKLVAKYFWAFMVLAILVGLGIGLIMNPVVTGEAGKAADAQRSEQGQEQTLEMVLKNWDHLPDQVKIQFLEQWEQETLAGKYGCCKIPGSTGGCALSVDCASLDACSIAGCQSEYTFIQNQILEGNRAVVDLDVIDK